MLMDKTYAIIVTYNGEKWIKKSLESVIKQCAVIVVDNNSTDNTLEIIRNNFPVVNLIKQNKNLGFGKANNIGISKALELGAEYILLMNQDVYLTDDIVSNLVSGLNENKDYGILSPIHLSNDKTIEGDFFRYASKNKKIFFDALYSKDKKSNIYEVPYVNAACWALSKHCIEKVGGFDTNFFHYGEDENYCQRVLYHNLKIGILTNSFIIHDTPDLKNTPKRKFSKKYYLAYKKFLMVEFGNINKHFDDDFYRNNIKKQVVLMIKSILFFRMDDFFGYLKKYRIIKKMKKTILKSRLLNKEIGIKYLR